ncbi:hypothetical protein D3C75_1090100 [compost metagenome]
MGLAGHDHFPRTDCHGAVQVESASQVIVIGRTQDKTVTIGQVRLHRGHGGQAHAIGIGGRGSRDTLQHVILKVFTIGQRGIVITPALPRRARTDAAGPLFS